jgi:transposase
MSDKSNKLTRLNLIKHTRQAFSLSDILALLNPARSERTIRRWLNDYVEQGVLDKRKALEGNTLSLGGTQFNLASKIILIIQKPMISLLQPTFQRDASFPS